MQICNMFVKRCNSFSESNLRVFVVDDELGSALYAHRIGIAGTLRRGNFKEPNPEGALRVALVDSVEPSHILMDPRLPAFTHPSC